MRYTLLFVLVFWSQEVSAIEWSRFNGTWPAAGPRLDIPEEVLAGDVSDWQAATSKVLRDHLDALRISPVLAGPDYAGTWKNRGYVIEQYNFGFGKGPTIESLLAVPDRLDAFKPLVVALHGHAIVPWGKAPHALFKSWAGQWAAAGYAVWAPSHLWYDELSVFYRDSCSSARCDDYHIVWVKMLERLWDAVQGVLPAHNGTIITGHSSGSLSARILMAARPGEFQAGIFSAHPTLDYCRENCRHISHPPQWNIEWVQSYLVFDLLHDAPTQHQIGRRDPYFPGNMIARTAANPGATHPPLWGTLIGQHRAVTGPERLPST